MGVLAMVLTLLVMANGFNFQGNLEPKLNEIIGVIDQSSEFSPIKEWLITYTSTSYSMDEKTIGKSFYRVNNMIKYLNMYFVNSIGTYFINILKSYCQKALEIIVQMTDQINILNDITIFDHDFCIVTYLDVFKYSKIKPILKTTHFLTTISFHGPSYYSLSFLRTQLYKIIKYELGFDEENLYDQTSNKNFHYLIEKLMSVKNDIKKFSNIFCLPSLLPLIDIDIHTREDKGKKDPFIDYIIKEESCCINVSTYRSTTCK